MKHFTAKNAVRCLMLAHFHPSQSVLERDRNTNLADEFTRERSPLNNQLSTEMGGRIRLLTSVEFDSSFKKKRKRRIEQRCERQRTRRRSHLLCGSRANVFQDMEKGATYCVLDGYL